MNFVLFSVGMGRMLTVGSLALDDWLLKRCC